MIRKHLWYSGRVQGVGFRATAAWLAQESRVAGFVRNLPDGRVELVAQGLPADIDRFLGRLAAHFSGHIRGVDGGDEPAGVQLDGFTVRP